MKRAALAAIAALTLTVVIQDVASAQASQQRSNATAAAVAGGGTVAAVAHIPSAYTIGPEDVLSIVFWREKDMSADVVVQPDGKITLPLLNEVQAAGLTPEQLRSSLTQAASSFLEEPTPSVVVKEIRSRSVYITGNVTKPASYSLIGGMTVLQLIAVAGGLLEYADAKHIVVVRMVDGKPQYLDFNYSDAIKQKNAGQIIMLRPGDTVVVP